MAKARIRKTGKAEIPLGTPQDRLRKAMEAGVPQIYANGFVTMMGSGDVAIVLEKVGQPQAIINMSFTCAKTLSVKIGQLIASLEERSKRDIMITDDIEAMFRDDNA